MKFNLLSATNGKKKLGALLVCGALVAAIGAVSAAASDSFTSLQIKYENGAKLYSTDNGETWSEQAPAGVTETVDADGKVTVQFGSEPKEGDGGLLTKMEDGFLSYSTDGGKTWTTQTPEDVKEGSITQSPDGSTYEVSLGEAGTLIRSETTDADGKVVITSRTIPSGENGGVR